MDVSLRPVTRENVLVVCKLEVARTAAAK